MTISCAEIKGLKARRSNIDERQIAMRRSLCQALNVSEEEMPFAGELLQVREDERDWEGAIERLLRGFGLSLLVPDVHYARVADWVDRTHLRGGWSISGCAKGGAASAVPASRLPGAQAAAQARFALYDWLEREVAHRFDLACCRRRSSSAARPGHYPAGQIKAPGSGMKRMTATGSMIAAVCAGLEQRRKDRGPGKRAKRLETHLAELAGRIRTLQKEQGALKERLTILSKLDEYPTSVSSTGSRWPWTSPGWRRRSASWKPPRIFCRPLRRSSLPWKRS
jgi:uncharacterized protein YPO0396